MSTVPPPPPPPTSSEPESAVSSMDTTPIISAQESNPVTAESESTTETPKESVDVQQSSVIPTPPVLSSIPPPPPPPPPAPKLAELSTSTADTTETVAPSEMKVPRKNQNFNSASLPQDPNSLVSTISKTVIPAAQVSLPHSKNTYDGYSSQSKIILPPLNLPKGVILPPTMDPSILATSDRALALLKELSASQIQAALNEFDEAMKNKGKKVRNTQAYLVGVIKRYLHVNRKERSSANDPVMGKEVTPVVKVTLQKLIDSNFCTQADLTNNVMAKLKMLSEHDALLAINEVAGVPRGTIRNFSSYFMGILNRYMRGEETPNKHRIGRTRNAIDIGVPNGNGNKHAIGYDSVYGTDGRKDRRGDRRPRRKDDDHSDRRRRSRSFDSDYSDDRSNSRTRRGRRSRRHDDYSDDDRSRSSSSDRDYRDSRRSRRGRDRSRSSSQDRHRRDRRRFSRSRSRSRSRSPYSKRRDKESRRSSRKPSSNNDSIIQSAIPAGYPGSLPPPPPPPPVMNMNPPAQQPQWPNPHQYSQQTAAPLPQYQYPTNATYTQMGTTTQPSLQAMPDLADILGIAEKAASAVQALNNRQQQQQQQQLQLPPTLAPTVPPSLSHYGPPPVPYTNVNQQHNEKPVKITDLTPMIQYSITNLRATGMLDKDLGENACRLLKKMHESVALQALEKFSSCDGAMMRSKEGYLIGILRKASEKS